jgi:hypothetical protein
MILLSEVQQIIADVLIVSPIKENYGFWYPNTPEMHLP